MYATMAAVFILAVSAIQVLSLSALSVTGGSELGARSGTNPGRFQCIEIDDVPEMSQLTELKIPEKPFTVRIAEDIGRDHMNLGACLLNDKAGNKLREIEEDYPRTEKRVNEIFHQWIMGKGQVDGEKSNTWRRLIQCLKTARLMTLVDKINSAFCPGQNKPSSTSQGGTSPAPDMSNSEMPPVKHGQTQDDISSDMNLETSKNHKTLENDHSDSSSDKASDKANSAKDNGSRNTNIGLGIFFIIGAIIIWQYGGRRNERIASDGEQGDEQQGSLRKYMRAINIPWVLFALGLYFLLGPESGKFKEFLSTFGVP